MAKGDKRPVLDLPETGTTQDWTAIRERIEADREAAKQERAAVQERRRGLALRAASGDVAALEEMAELNARQVSAGRQLDVLELAGSEAGERLAEAREREADTAAAARRAECALRGWNLPRIGAEAAAAPWQP